MKKKTISFFAFLLLLTNSISLPVNAQRIDRARTKVQEYQTENWPPVKTHYRLSLGGALQRIFKKHYDYCGFAQAEGSRDYLPADIGQFIGKRDLRTRVELADLHGGSLLHYIFMADETAVPLNDIHFHPDRLIQLSTASPAFQIQPAAPFDAFLLTKNCSGYLKASLDAGIDPPYSAFKAALQTDERKESTVVAISGTFVSPLEQVLRARDAQTTALMLELWLFYQHNPAYIGKAFYLRAFEGVMLRHTASSQEGRLIETQVGININVPLLAQANAQAAWTRSSEGSFTGTDWETVVFADFNERYTRQQWYAPLPTPAQISAYFAELRPAFLNSQNPPLMTEGTEYSHYITLEGIPEALARSPWELREVAPGIYQQNPRLEASPFAENGRMGCRFGIIGQPAPAIFMGDAGERPGKVALRYQLRSTVPVGGYVLTCQFDDEVPTSAHPVAALGDGRFDVSLKEDRRFALQWKAILQIEDTDNPVDFSILPSFSDLRLRREDQSANLDIQVKEVIPDARRRQYQVVFETVSTWPLLQIDDQALQTYQLNCTVHLPAQRSTQRMQRPLKGRVTLPGIMPTAPVPVQEVVPVPVPVPAGGG